MAAVRIIPTAVSDIVDVVEFVNASWVRTYATLIGQETARELAATKHTKALFSREIDANDALSWIAKTTEGEVVGHVGGFICDNSTMFIDRFHVSPKWHGRGLANQLEDAVSKDAAAKGCHQLELTVLEGNDRALAFYLKCGFQCDEARSPTEGLSTQKALTLVKALE